MHFKEVEATGTALSSLACFHAVQGFRIYSGFYARDPPGITGKTERLRAESTNDTGVASQREGSVHLQYQ